MLSKLINNHYNNTIIYYNNEGELESYKEPKNIIVFVDVLTILMGFFITTL